jgi:hypothetical protein
VFDPFLYDARGVSTCDHFAIHVALLCTKPGHTEKTLTYRKWKTVDWGEFSKDIILDNVSRGESICDLVNVYKLRDVVEKHAPLVTKSVILRPNTKWYSQELRDAKRDQRKAERTWRKTGLEIHKQILRQKCSTTSRLLHQTKQEYYTQKIKECGDQKQLFKLSNTLMGNNRNLLYHPPNRLLNCLTHSQISSSAKLKQ